MPIDTSITSATGTTSATIPTHAAGDLIVAFAFRDGSATPPSLPSGRNWSSPPNATRAGTTCSHRTAYKVAASGSEATGTFTNATSFIVLVIKGAHRGQPIGNDAVNSGSSTSINFPAVSPQTQDGSSYVLGFCGHRSANVSITTAPSGMTNITSVSDATDEAAAHRTTAATNSWASTNASVGGTSSGWTSHTIEIRSAQNMAAGPGLQDLSNAITQIEAGLQSLKRGYAAIVGGSYWDPANKSTTVTLSNSDKTCEGDGSYGGLVRSVTQHTTGKYYAEFACAGFDGFSAVGVSNGTGSVDQYLGADADGAGYSTETDAGDGIVIESSAYTAYGTELVNGDVLGVAVDLTNDLIYFAVNDVWQNSANPVAGTGGYAYSVANVAFLACSPGAVGTTITFRSQDADFTETKPTGFTAWG